MARSDGRHGRTGYPGRAGHSWFARFGWPLTFATAALALGACVLTGDAALAVPAKASAPHAGARSSAASLVCPLDDREPLSDGGPVKGVPQRRSADTTLVPAGAVGLTICDYNGMNATRATPQFGLLGIGVTDRSATLRRLTRELDAIEVARRKAAYSCPADDASQAILSFVYRSGPADLVTVGMSGCNPIANAIQATISYPIGGPPTHLALGAPVISQIAALAGPVKLRWAAVSGEVRVGRPVSRAVAENSSEMWVSMAHVKDDRFHFRIATPGRYTIRLMGSGGAINRTVARLRVTVSTGRTSRVTFTRASA